MKNTKSTSKNVDRWHVAAAELFDDCSHLFPQEFELAHGGLHVLPIKPRFLLNFHNCGAETRKLRHLRFVRVDLWSLGPVLIIFSLLLGLFRQVFQV